jgi:diadenosine tetraphosphate (Ap4A) HIT family hydrolase
MRAMLASLFVLSQTLFASYCPFCDPAVIERQAFYEDDLVIVLYNYKPIFPGHSLIIPKRHIENFAHLTEEEITQIGRAIKKTHLLVSEVFRKRKA